MQNFLYKLLLKSSSILGRTAQITHKLANSIECSKKQEDQWTALNEIDTKIAHYLPEILNSQTFYVEAGANDGINQSNTHFLEKIYGARGLLIEASQSLFEKCLKNRCGSNIFALCALVEDTYKHEYVDLIYSNLMTVSQQSTDVDPYEHAIRGLEHFDGSNYEFAAKAKNLDQLLEENCINKVDLLSLDIEGNELNALRGANLRKNKIKNIVIETRTLENIQQYLSSHNYLLKAKLSHHDYLFSLANG